MDPKDQQHLNEATRAVENVASHPRSVNYPVAPTLRLQWNDMNRWLDLTAVAHLVGDPSRLKMLVALRDEGELSAGELAAVAGVSPQTTSAHLYRLQWGKLVERIDGAYGSRHHVFRLTGTDVAKAVEALSALATFEPEATLKTIENGAKLCYGHLGGTLGNALLAAFLDQKLLEPIPAAFKSVYDYRVTTEGAEVLGGFGIDLTKLQKQRRHFASRCLNAHQANAHLSGSLAEALLEGLLERKWVVRDEAHSRVLELTEAGKDGLASRFAVRL